MSGPLSIRIATSSDREALVELLAAQFRGHGIKLASGSLERAVEGMLVEASRGRILAADVGGRLAGVAVLSFIWALEHGGQSAWLDELYVIPQMRRRGIGRALLRQAIDEAVRQGCAALDLEVERSQRKAERLYRSEGFRRHQRPRWVRLPPR